jgi:hypothetical protein
MQIKKHTALTSNSFRVFRLTAKSSLVARKKTSFVVGSDADGN